MRDFLKSINLITLPSPFLIDDLSFPNLGILYLSAILKEHNYDVKVIDLHGYQDWKQELSNYLQDDVDMWGISCVTPEFPLAVEAMKEIRLSNPAARVSIGGPMATCDSPACLDAGFDHVIAGEGERAILKLMEGYRDSVIKEPYIHNLDEIPMPDRRAIDINRYHYLIDNKKSTNIITSRGCFWSKCKFCCQIWDNTIRYRSADNVIKEIDYLYGMGFDGVCIYDDEFFSKKERDYKICEFIKERGMSYRCLTRSDLITDKVASIAAETGCNEILLGIESGSNKILSTIQKGVTREDNEAAINILRDYGIKVKGLFVIGLPGESNETIDETVSFIERAQPDHCEFTVFTPYPNTDFWERPQLYDIIYNRQEIISGGAWYKGIKGNYVSYVKTSSLTAEEIVNKRDELEKRFGFCATKNSVP